MPGSLRAPRSEPGRVLRILYTLRSRMARAGTGLDAVTRCIAFGPPCSPSTIRGGNPTLRYAGRVQFQVTDAHFEIVMVFPDQSLILRGIPLCIQSQLGSLRQLPEQTQRVSSIQVQRSAMYTVSVRSMLLSAEESPFPHDQCVFLGGGDFAAAPPPLSFAGDDLDAAGPAPFFGGNGGAGGGTFGAPPPALSLFGVGGEGSAPKPLGSALARSGGFSFLGPSGAG